MGLLDVQTIREPISAEPRAKLDSLEVFDEIESTNCYLLEQAAPPPGRFRVALAEHQTAGRGRMDRHWYSPPSSGLCMSLSYTFARTPASLSCVTLAVGVGVAEALQRIGVRGVGLKWPNDIVVRDGKLGGILTETRSGQGKGKGRDKDSGCTVVVGVGINVDLESNPDAKAIRTRIGHVSDLKSCTTSLPSRSVMSALLIEALFNTLAEFEANGFGRFFDAWIRYDWLRGQRVSIEQTKRTISGVCEGIDHDGALMLRTDAGRQRVLAGSVHLHGQQVSR